jgi:hypothetical protein
MFPEAGVKNFCRAKITEPESSTIMVNIWIYREVCEPGLKKIPTGIYLKASPCHTLKIFLGEPSA